MKTISLTPLRALSTKRRLIFIDQNVSDYQTLIQGVLPDSEVYLLDVQQDGISQITARLQGEPVDSIHLVAHGYPEGLVLGNSELNLKTLSDYASEIEQWTCDYLIIYGCQTGAQGQLIERLQELTGAAVAASSSEIGPQWRLDVTRGG
ncbi:DUF4347 domain-containing protein [Gloeocapsa sp. PCC 73106]|uniref:DUF4347 domain-containing protein n=1 Tax=Gloeocapsa sp. PCC 73106 TaxID=102232 RepID=UPI0002AD19F7|nr:DUF4347 domain-containing protein [Gloeocapsa sp. PCC 73106]ELR99974.1 hypothetical protein GLO73106DRAFT_00038280 [Gloeocapsa sp. PCC 73106]